MSRVPMAADNNKTKSGGVFNSEAKEKPCRACTDFRSWMTAQSGAGQIAGIGKIGGGEAPSSSSSRSQTEGHQKGATGQTGSDNASSKYGDNGQGKGLACDEPEYPLKGDAAKYGCPADSLALGRGSWRLLHSMAAYYPEKPTAEQQDDMSSFIRIFSKFYPCAPCADDFRNWMKSNTPDVSSGYGLSRWFCDAHNEVNVKLENLLTALEKSYRIKPNNPYPPWEMYEHCHKICITNAS